MLKLENISGFKTILIDHFSVKNNFNSNMISKPFSIYFPQFYPTKVNNCAWGNGFTDWVLVANANMRNLWQRRAPKSGFYDGSCPTVHARQIAEAKSAGLGGFAVYHYWFYPRQELSAFEESLRTNVEIDSSIPWFLIWASEGWSKRWLGDPEILIKLTIEPSMSDIEIHCDYLMECFLQPRYMRWNNMPMFVIYNLSHFKRPEALVDMYRLAMQRRNLPIAIMHFIKNPYDIIHSSYTDASYIFEPRLFFGFQKLTRGQLGNFSLKIVKKLIGINLTERFLIAVDSTGKGQNRFTQDEFISYIKSQRRNEFLSKISHPWQEVISPGWDNTPRYGDRHTALASIDPQLFRGLILDSIHRCDLPVLVNAWNEWSEGAAIEPCSYIGRDYLDVLSGF